MVPSISDQYIRDRGDRDSRYFWVVLGPGDVGSKLALYVYTCKADALYQKLRISGASVQPVPKGFDNDYPGGIYTADDAARYAQGTYEPVDASERARRRYETATGRKAPDTVLEGAL